MTTHVSRTITTCSLHMRKVAPINRYLTQPTTERVVSALITSRLDYCNSLLFGTSASNINRLQRLQHFVARLVTRQYTPARSRSASSCTRVQNISHSAAGDCTFVHAAVTVWNTLPVSVTSKDSLLSFKAALTTDLCA